MHAVGVDNEMDGPVEVMQIACMPVSRIDGIENKSAYRAIEVRRMSIQWMYRYGRPQVAPSPEQLADHES